jgi:hypothetical protein
VQSIGVGKAPGRPGTKWTLLAVRDALTAGHEFFVDVGDASVHATVEECSCGTPDLRIDEPGGTDVLAQMQTCAWSTAPVDAGALTASVHSTC